MVLAGAVPATADDSWRHSISPYPRLPTVNGSLNYGLPPSLGNILEVMTGPNDYLTHLKLASVVSSDARKGVTRSFPT